MNLTDRQSDVLKLLKDNPGWNRPMDIGSYNGSHHSSTLAQLWRKGLVDRAPRNTLSNYLYGATEDRAASFCYRINKKGLKNDLT